MMRRIVVTVLVLLTGMAAEPVAAGYSPPEAPPAPDPGPLLLRLFGMTLFVLILCAGVMWLLRFAGRPRLFRGGDPAKLRSLQAVTLGARCSVHLVQAGNCRILIAVDSTGIKTCQVVDDDFAGILPTAESRGGAGPSVAEMMSLLAASRAAA